MQFENSINMRTKKKKNKKTQIITNYLYCYSSMADQLNPFGSMTKLQTTDQTKIDTYCIG
jgi:hypothetical protein